MITDIKKQGIVPSKSSFSFNFLTEGKQGRDNNAATGKTRHSYLCYRDP